MSENKIGLGLFAEENMSTGGFQGGRAKIVSARVKQIQLDPNKPGREPMLVLDVKDAAGEDHSLRYGLGKDSDKRFAITDGGKRFEGRNGAMLNKSCKAALLVKSIVAADFDWPAAALPKKANQSPDLGCLDGSVVEFKQAVMEVGDKILADRKLKGQGAPTVLLIDAFVDAGSAGKASEEPEPEAEGEEDESAAKLAAFVAVVKDALSGGPLSESELKVAVLSAVEADEDLAPHSDDLMALLDDADNYAEMGLATEAGKDSKGKKATIVSDPEAKPKPAKKGLKLGK